MYANYDITFPSLGLTFKAGRTAFHIAGRPIYWYGIIIALGFALAIFYAVKNCKRFGVNEDDLFNLILIGTPVSVIFSRLYYVVFNFGEYRGNFKSVFQIWNGGLAIYGVIIGAVLTLVVYAKLRKMKILPFLDLLTIGFIIGQTLGRWGNFMNREAFGLIPAGTTGFLRTVMDFFTMNFVNGTEIVSVQPTFLYESVWNLIVLLVLVSIVPKRKFDGEVALVYFGLYGFGRFFIEGLRTDSLMLFNTGIRVSQLVAALSFVAAAVLLVWILVRKKPDGSGLEYLRLKAIEDEKLHQQEAEEAEREARAALAQEEKLAQAAQKREELARQAEEIRQNAASQNAGAINRPYVAPKSENQTEEQITARRAAKAKMIEEARQLGLILDEDGNFIEQIDVK